MRFVFCASPGVVVPLVAAALAAATLTGCGSQGAAAGSRAVAGVALADMNGSTRYVLSVEAGALTLTPGGSATGSVLSSLTLSDGATGATFALTVDGGALRVAPTGTANGTSTELSLTDAEDRRSYSLAVHNGGLTLTPN